ncbi:MAG: hypothetical protein ABSC51_05390 [Gaiellaceae bacterium]|jgi:hypothetical protein
MSTSDGYDLNARSEPDPWPSEPPPELLEALDRAAARLTELDAKGVSLSLGIGADGGPRPRLSREGFAREIDLSLLLRLVCESNLEVPWVSAV